MYSLLTTDYILRTSYCFLPVFTTSLPGIGDLESNSYYRCSIATTDAVGRVPMLLDFSIHASQFGCDISLNEATYRPSKIKALERSGPPNGLLKGLQTKAFSRVKLTDSFPYH